MTTDPTEELRRRAVLYLNTHPRSREQLEAVYGQVWDTQQLQEDFQVKGFLAPFVSVTRKSDSRKGLLTFQHLPRFYFGFEEAYGGHNQTT